MKNRNNKIFLLAINLFIPFLAGASEGQHNPNFYPNLLKYLLVLGAGIVVLMSVVKLIKLLNLIILKKQIEIYREKGIEESLYSKPKKESLWSKFSRKMTDVVPIEKESDILLDHNYDGIRELDNNLPPWWLYGFYLTIVIGFLYVGYYHFSDYGKSSAEYYEIEMEEARLATRDYLAAQANLINESNVELLEDEDALAAGKAIFMNNCVACHLASGGGSPSSVGPNLTDEYWVHGGGIKNVFKTIKYGIPDKGMIAWKTQISPGDIHKVASYVLSLQGTNPPGAKGPEGEKYVEE